MSPVSLDDVATRACNPAPQPSSEPVNVKALTCRYDYTFGNARLFVGLKTTIRFKSEFRPSGPNTTVKRKSELSSQDLGCDAEWATAVPSMKSKSSHGKSPRGWFMYQCSPLRLVRHTRGGTGMAQVVHMN